MVDYQFSASDLPAYASDSSSGDRQSSNARLLFAVNLKLQRVLREQNGHLQAGQAGRTLYRKLKAEWRAREHYVHMQAEKRSMELQMQIDEDLEIRAKLVARYSQRRLGQAEASNSATLAKAGGPASPHASRDSPLDLLHRSTTTPEAQTKLARLELQRQKSAQSRQAWLNMWDKPKPWISRLLRTSAGQEQQTELASQERELYALARRDKRKAETSDQLLELETRRKEELEKERQNTSEAQRKAMEMRQAARTKERDEDVRALGESMGCSQSNVGRRRANRTTEM